jgi:hypothetical protein
MIGELTNPSVDDELVYTCICFLEGMDAVLSRIKPFIVSKFGFGTYNWLVLDHRLRYPLLFLNGIREVLADTRDALWNDTTFGGTKLWESLYRNLNTLYKAACIDLKGEVKAYKSWCAWATARSLNQTEFPSDFRQILSGRLKNEVLIRLTRRHSLIKQAQFGWSLGQVKRACAPLPAELVSEKLADHAATLTREAQSISDEFLCELEGIVDSLLAGWSFSFKDLFPAESGGSVPSSSASLHSKVDEGGGYAYLYSVSHEPSIVASPEFIGIDELGSDVFVNRPNLSPIFQKIIDVSRLFKEGVGLDWKVQGILEPLKLRVITKGDEATQWLAKGLQLSLHRHLRTLPMFSYIGMPVDIGLLSIQMTQAYAPFLGNKGFNPEELRWVSGDYSAATDKLNIHITEAIFDCVLSRFRGLSDAANSKAPSPELLDLAFSVPDAFRALLSHGHLIYENRQCPLTADITSHGLPPAISNGREGSRLVVPQRNGQLMGSILSFPLLCLANFACLIMAFRRMSSDTFGPDPTYKDWFIYRLYTGMAQINGDDILFPVCNLEQYRRWSCFIPSFGFEKSMGKNFVHRDFFTINTELYHVKVLKRITVATDDEKNSAFYEQYIDLTRIDYFACGLLIGQHKVTGRRETRTLPMNTVLSLVLQSAENPLRAYRRFLMYNRSWVSRSTLGGLVNLGLPIPFGGLGVPLASYGIPVHVTRLQKAVMSKSFAMIASNLIRPSELSDLCTNLGRSKKPIPGYAWSYRPTGKFVVQSNFIPLPPDWQPVSRPRVARSVHVLNTPVVVVDEDCDRVTGSRLFLKIMKSKQHVAFLHEDVNKMYRFLVHLRDIPIGSDDQDTKTVVAERDSNLNTSVPMKHEFYPVQMFITPRDYDCFSVSRDCTVSGPFCTFHIPVTSAYVLQHEFLKNLRELHDRLPSSRV